MSKLPLANSEKAENYAHALAIYFTFYNFVRIHKTPRVTPAIAAGLTDWLWSMEDVVALVDARGAMPPKRGAYKPRASKASISN